MPAPTDSSSNRWILSWKPTMPPANPLPEGITRSFISTPSGALELLSAKPASNSISAALQSPILFCHGGFGCAEVYVPWLQHLASRGYNVHAMSIRGHGHSWTPGFFRMTFLTTASTLATDIASGVAYLEREYGKKGEVILAGHSSGGGLVQMVCDQELAEVKALILIAGTPSFGADYVYRSWWRMDPWFLPRMYIRDWFHPRSPLSSTELVKAAFFCPSFPLAQVKPFEKLMSETESLLWPVNVMWRGYVDTRRVLLGCKMRLFVLAGQLDPLMQVELMERTAAEYGIALKDMERDGVDVKGGRVGFDVVQGSGHHIMNDLQWEDGVQIVEEWLKELNADA